ncbi:hypothetical protein ACET3Z_023071 [Daucus carota]
MAQWETAGLEAKSRLSKETTLLIQLSYGHTTTEKYYLLRMWNSEVGESFRNLNKSGAEISACRSSFSQVKSLLTINPANETPMKNITIRRIPRKFST